MPDTGSAPRESAAFLIDLDFAALWFDVRDNEQIPYRSQALGHQASRLGEEDPDCVVQLASTGIDTEDMLYTLDLRAVAMENLPDDLGSAKGGPASQSVHLRHHLYRHDLEGFFWSIWWLVLGAHPDHRSKNHKHFADWGSERPMANRRAKEYFLFKEKQRWIPTVVQQLWPESELSTAMSQFLQELTVMFEAGHRDILEIQNDAAEPVSLDDLSTAFGQITYSKFMHILDSAVGVR